MGNPGETDWLGPGLVEKSSPGWNVQGTKVHRWAEKSCLVVLFISSTHYSIHHLPSTWRDWNTAVPAQCKPGTRQVPPGGRGPGQPPTCWGWMTTQEDGTGRKQCLAEIRKVSWGARPLGGGGGSGGGGGGRRQWQGVSKRWAPLVTQTHQEGHSWSWACFRPSHQVRIASQAANTPGGVEPIGTKLRHLKSASIMKETNWTAYVKKN